MKDRRRPVKDEVDITFDDINIGVGTKQLDQILHALKALSAQGAHLMAQIDDVKAALAATKSTLGVIDAKSDEILAEVKAGGANMDLTEVAQGAADNAAAAEALRQKVQSIDDALDGVAST